MSQPSELSAEGLCEDIVTGVFDQPYPNHWGEITIGEGPFARRALIEAAELRASGDLDSGDAYLQGFAAALKVSRLIGATAEAWAGIAKLETTESPTSDNS